MLFAFLPPRGVSYGCFKVLPQGQAVGPCDFQVVSDTLPLAESSPGWLEGAAHKALTVLAAGH